MSVWCKKWNEVANLCDENHKWKATNKDFMDKECPNECTETNPTEAPTGNGNVAFKSLPAPLYPGRGRVWVG